MSRPGGQKLRVLIALLATFAALYLVSNTLVVLALLVGCWLVVFYPLRAAELVMFAVAGVFFLVQNYVCLRAGLFEFRDQDILLMPYYEPLLWGFYFLSMRRFLASDGSAQPRVGWRSVTGLAATSLAFSFFSYDPDALLVATLCSTALLLVMFHTRLDLQYATFALVLGFIVELFGVSTGLWSYPESDFLGIPYWFATMWLSVGLLGWRFLIPVAEWLAAGRMSSRHARA